MGMNEGDEEMSLMDEDSDEGKRMKSGSHVLGPALAIESRNGFLCLSVRFSSANFSP